MEKVYRILAVNPGSTSTKVAVFENEKEVFKLTVEHDPAELKKFQTVQDQLNFRKETVEKALADHNIDIKSIDIFSGRGGGLLPSEGGVYEVNDIMLGDASTGSRGRSGNHPAQLGCQICNLFAKENDKEAYIVNSPDTDEFIEIARITGLKDIVRICHSHALNQKETLMRYCEKSGKAFNETNAVVCHIGGGISIMAHEKGKMIDGNDIIRGEGPLTPTRAGALPTVDLINMCFSGKYTKDEIYKRISKDGGLIDHLGVSDARKVEKMIEEGDKYAKIVYDAMIYQIAKNVGYYACALKGKVDVIILTGGMSNSKYLTQTLKEYVSWIAPVEVMAGEFEMEALAGGVLRVKQGKIKAKTYTGIPVWDGFDK